MSIYGSINNGNVVVNEAAYWEKRKGLQLINKTRSNPETVNIYAEDGTFYIATTDLQRFVESSGIVDISEAVEMIAEANNIYKSDIVICYDGGDDYIREMVEESYDLTLEASAEDGAMSVKQAEKWFNTFISAAKSKSENIEQIDNKIEVLKETVRKMESALNTNEGRIKYSLKALIPFNMIYRVATKGDTTAATSWLIGVGVSMIGLPFGNIVGRYALWKDMIKNQIIKTNQAIEYLEKEKAKMQNK